MHQIEGEEEEETPGGMKALRERERDAFDIFFGQLIKLLKGAHEHRWNHYYLK